MLPFLWATLSIQKIIWSLQSSHIGKKLPNLVTPYDMDTMAQYYKTFYGLNLQMFIMSKNVCPWQAFPS